MQYETAEYKEHHNYLKLTLTCLVLYFVEPQ